MIQNLIVMHYNEIVKITYRFSWKTLCKYNSYWLQLQRGLDFQALSHIFTFIHIYAKQSRDFWWRICIDLKKKILYSSKTSRANAIQYRINCSVTRIGSIQLSSRVSEQFAKKKKKVRTSLLPGKRSLDT